MSSELRRALDFMSAVENSCADRIEPYRWGVAVFNDEFPRVHDFNFLRVEGAPGDVVFDELVAEAERLQGAAGLEHRKIVIEDERLGRTFLPHFRMRGWDPAALVVMVYREANVLPPTGDEVRELALHEVRSVRAESLATTSVAKDPEGMTQLLDKDAVFVEVAGGRFFGVIADGRPVCSADLYSDGSTAQIESVLTLKDYRRRGFGRAVVVEALRAALEAGHDFVFLIADEEDWPKDLYARMGFDPVGVCWDFTLMGD